MQLCILLGITAFTVVHTASYQTIYADLVLSNDRLNQTFSSREAEHARAAEQHQAAVESTREALVSIQPKIAELNQQLIDLKALLEEGRTERTLLEERTRTTRAQIQQKTEEQDRRQQIFLRLTEESRALQEQYQENKQVIRTFQDEISGCVTVLDQYAGRRYNHHLEETIMYLLWQSEAAILKEVIQKQALKKFGIDLIVTTALTISGVGLSYKIGAKAMKAGQWAFRVLNAAQGPVGSFMTNDEPKRKERIANIHAAHSAERLAQYTDEEKMRVLEELQGEAADGVIDLDAWKQKSIHNVARYDNCVARQKATMEQDLNDHPHKASGFLTAGPSGV